MIYVRSRRPIMTLGLVGLAAAIAFGALAVLAFSLPAGAVAGYPLLAGAGGGTGLAAWAAIQLQRWPAGKLALFRDRLVVIQGRHEMRAVWSLMETITLAAPAAWPDVRLTDRLTINLKKESPLTFKPAVFGLAPTACRDLILRLRDDAKLRSRLPEFDSARDLAISPVVAGELSEPRL
ncbi:MAG TPA: hypothetical protein VJT78_11030 [Candidatus Dormibacteraeota bacterium]|nr:hypothetical protein [Candidatus Dormibacteraeota bacterium]